MIMITQDRLLFDITVAVGKVFDNADCTKDTLWYNDTETFYDGIMPAIEHDFKK